MADTAKYMPINGGTTLVTDFKSLFSFIRTRRTVAFFMCAFVGFTVFLAFSPSSNSSSPWFTNIFSTTSSTAPGTASADSRSQFSSIFDYFFSNTSSSSSSSPQQQQELNFTSFSNNVRSNNTVPQLAKPREELPFHKNSTKTPSFNTNEELASSKNTTFHSPNTNKSNTQSSILHANQTTVSPPSVNKNPPSTSNKAEKKENSDKAQVLKANQTTIVTQKAPVAANKSTNSPAKSKETSDKAQVLKANQTTIVTEKAPAVANQSTNSPAKSDSSSKVSSGNGEKSVAQKGVVSKDTASLTKKQGNGKNQGNGNGSGQSAKQGGIESLVESLMNCDLFDGEWVKDNSYPLYKPGSCSFIDLQFSCIGNGRPDRGYQKLKWKPKGCTLPR